MKESIKITDKTQEQLMTANWKDLNLEEKALRSDLERHPKMSWEDAGNCQCLLFCKALGEIVLLQFLALALACAKF